MAKLQELALKYWWIAAIVVAFFGWLHQHDSAVKFQALAEERQQELVNRSVELHKRDVQLAKQDTIIAQQNKSLKDANVKIQQKINETTHVVSDQVAALRESLDSAQKIALDSVVSHYGTIIELKDQQIRNLARVIANDSTQIKDKNDQIAGYKKLNDDLLKQVDKLTDYTRPSLLGKIERVAPWIITTGALIVAIKK